ncbi:MAG: EAL domain-containing protein [Solobacterium sp.]|nr:EAL domain-containing protein [Solobacterium sp.]
MIESGGIKRRHLVLIVDDHEINRDALGVTLEDEYDVIYAENGVEALKQIEAHINTLSIILLDLMMPEMNGFEVLDYMRNHPDMKRIPVIVLTAEKNAELEALQLGAADFITKPFDMPEVIIARVARIIELSDGRQLISAAEHDSLTNLYSINFFMEYANNISHFMKELHMDAISLNIEQFHTVNALHGREFGDHVLKFVGTMITEFLKQTTGIACRAEADRFMIYCLPQPDYGALLKHFQEQLSEALPNVNIHLRMGVQPYHSEMDPVQMFDRAVTACNMRRRDYQNPLMIYDEQMEQKELLNQRLINDLRAAVEEGQFTVFFQPKYDIQSNPPRLTSAEALVRWKHPELGLISPGTFIPLFEGNGLISVVDHYVWKQTGKQIAEWKKNYGFGLPISVNLSRTDVFDPELIGILKSVVEENDLTYQDLLLEISESAYTENARQMFDVINRIRSLGFRIEMDDFGSGYSSLNMLSEMPVDVLKMDMKFVRNIEVSETDLTLVRLVEDIAKYLKLKVVAEGVETEGQLSLLKHTGCDLVQGYYFSKPLPADEFAKLLEKEKRQRGK